MYISIDKSMLHQTMIQAWDKCQNSYNGRKEFEDILKEFIATQENNTFIEIPSMSPSGNFNTTIRSDEALYNKMNDIKNEILRKITTQNNQYLRVSGIFSFLVCVLVVYNGN